MSRLRELLAKEPGCIYTLSAEYLEELYKEDSRKYKDEFAGILKSTILDKCLSKKYEELGRIWYDKMGREDMVLCDKTIQLHKKIKEFLGNKLDRT